MSSNPPGWETPGDSGAQWQTPPPNTPPPGYQPAPGYGAPGGFGGGFAREHPDGTTVLVLGILSLVVCQILGPFAWVKGNSALREIDANPGMYTNRGNVSAGRICGIVASVFIIIGIAFFALVLVAGVASSST